MNKLDDILQSRLYGWMQYKRDWNEYFFNPTTAILQIKQGESELKERLVIRLLDVEVKWRKQ